MSSSPQSATANAKIWFYGVVCVVCVVCVYACVRARFALHSITVRYGCG
jgi:hypothetical protein